jgi:Tfp pilus assembly protein PilF
MSVDSAEKALKDLSFAMKIDPELAWAWHCNIAMVAQDAGAPHKSTCCAANLTTE